MLCIFVHQWGQAACKATHALCIWVKAVWQDRVVDLHPTGIVTVNCCTNVSSLCCTVGSIQQRSHGCAHAVQHTCTYKMTLCNCSVAVTPTCDGHHHDDSSKQSLCNSLSCVGVSAGQAALLYCAVWICHKHPLLHVRKSTVPAALPASSSCDRRDIPCHLAAAEAHSQCTALGTTLRQMCAVQH